MGISSALSGDSNFPGLVQFTSCTISNHKQLMTKLYVLCRSVPPILHPAFCQGGISISASPRVPSLPLTACAQCSGVAGSAVGLVCICTVHDQSAPEKTLVIWHSLYWILIVKNDSVRKHYNHGPTVYRTWWVLPTEPRAPTTGALYLCPSSEMIVSMSLHLKSSQ